MARRIATCFVMVAAVCLLSAANATDDEKARKTDKKPAAEKKFTAKCPISGRDAKEAMSVAYKDKKVYLCCGNCKKAFEKDSSKYAVKANHQLVQTKQYRQAKCPLSGGDVKKDTVVRMAKVPVRFCCGNCKAKAEAAKGDAQLAMAFSDEAFKKGFVARKAKKAGAKKDSAKKATDKKSDS